MLEHPSGFVEVTYHAGDAAAPAATATLTLTFSNVADAEALTTAYRWQLLDGRVSVDDWTARALALRLRNGECVQFCGQPADGRVTYSRDGDTVRFTHESPAPTRGFEVFSARSILPLPEPPPGPVRGFVRYWRGARLRDEAGWVRSRLPNGFGAAICFTDHADYDQTDALRCIFFGAPAAGARGAVAGFAAVGVPVTKSVFVHCPSGYTAVGLSDPAFRTFVEEIADTGSEIAAHLTRPVPTSREELRSDLQTLQFYGLRTWIDHHFTMPQALSCHGWDRRHSHYSLDLIEAAGVRNVWSYQDIDANRPDGELNMLADRPASPLMHFRAAVETDRCARPPGERVYHAIEALGMVTGRSARLNARLASDEWRGYLRGEEGSILAGVGYAAATLRDALRAVAGGRRQDVLPVFYQHPTLTAPASGRPFTLFATSRVNDVQRQYAPLAVDRLIDDRGIHIGHLYLGCRTHALRSGAAIDADGASRLRIAPAFAENLRHIGARQREGLLWCATLQELSDYYELSARVDVEPLDTGGVKVSNRNDRRVHGFTVVASRASGTLQARSQGFTRHTDAGWNAFSIDLDPGQSATLLTTAT